MATQEQKDKAIQRETKRVGRLQDKVDKATVKRDAAQAIIDKTTPLLRDAERDLAYAQNMPVNGVSEVEPEPEPQPGVDVFDAAQEPEPAFI